MMFFISLTLLILGVSKMISAKDPQGYKRGFLYLILGICLFHACFKVGY